MKCRYYCNSHNKWKVDKNDIIYQSNTHKSKEEKQIKYIITKHTHDKVSEYDQEIPQAQTADQPTPPWVRDKEISGRKLKKKQPALSS